MSDTSMAPDTGTDDATTDIDDTDVDTTDWKAEAEKFRALHRKQEERAKANAAAAKELADLKKSTMTDLERATQEAREAARSEALRESSDVVRAANGRVVAAEIRAAAAGRSINANALLDGIDPLRFVNDDGDVDTKAITTWLDKVAPAGEGTPPPRRTVDFGGGVRDQNVPDNEASAFGRFLSGQLDKS